MIQFVLTVLLLATTGVAQSVPVATVPLPEGYALTLMSDGTVGVGWDNDPLQGIVGNDQSVITTVYTSAAGEHTITTPIASKTPAGIVRAIREHKEVLEAFQREFPPVKDPSSTKVSVLKVPWIRLAA
jgi:hypothetical protein